MTKTSVNKSQPSNPPTDSASVIIPVCFLVGIGMGILGAPTILCAGGGMIAGYIIDQYILAKTKSSDLSAKKNEHK